MGGPRAGAADGGRGRPVVLLVGSGSAGYTCARRLERRLPPDAADLVMVSPVDHLLYTSLLPQVAAGQVEPRHLAVPLRRALRRTRLELGHAVAVDLVAHEVTVARADGSADVLTWDRLVLAPGAVTRLLDVPGLVEHAHGLKSLAEAVALRDHVLRCIEHADACSDPAERRAWSTFVVVGAGYTGTEVAAQMRQMTRAATAGCARLGGEDPRWVLLDVADRVLPELDPRLSAGALQVLRERDVDVRLGTSLTRVTDEAVTLSDGSVVPTRTLLWTAGVTPNPLVATLGLPTQRGRLTVDAHLRVPGQPGVFALGDAAAVPDLTQGDGALAGQTAQHATRQGPAAARNVAASLGHGRSRPYRHRDLGFVVDLGGADAVADPLGVPLAGVPAAAVTRGYHLLALPGAGRVRVAADWLLGAVLPPQVVQLGFVPESAWTVPAAESTHLVDAWREAASGVPRVRVEVTDAAVPQAAARELAAG